MIGVPPTSAAGKPRVRIYVKRGALRRFARLKNEEARLPVRVEWDRRTTERRGSSRTVTNDARTGDRRKPPGFTWEVAQLVVVEGDEE
jgi:hypothetical protein